MNLTERQKDALTELINIAFSRAAASLSDLTKNRVTLDRPAVSIHPIADLLTAIGGSAAREVATVHQIFSGPVAGDALLVLDHDGALALVELLTGEPVAGKAVTPTVRDVLTEVGNILLNACLGMFGNLLQVHVSFSVPQLHLESLSGLIGSILVGTEELRYALVISTRFHIQTSEVNGYLMIALGVASMDRLLQTVETMG